MGRYKVDVIVLLASFVLAGALPVAAAPIAGLHYLVGTWKCTYRGGAASLAYDATWANDLDGHSLRQVDSWPGGGAEELLAYDAHRGWTAVIFDGQGDATVMRGTGGNANRFAYRSVYPDTSIAVTFDRISASKYSLHGTVRSGGKTITSVDTCLRGSR